VFIQLCAFPALQAMQGGPSPTNIRPAGQAVQPNMLQPGGIVYTQQAMQQQQQQQQQQVRLAAPAQGQAAPSAAAATVAKPAVVMPAQFPINLMSLLQSKTLASSNPGLFQMLQQQQRMAAGLKPEAAQQQVQVQQLPMVPKLEQQQVQQQPQQQQMQTQQQQMQQQMQMQQMQQQLQQQQQQQSQMVQMMQQRGTQQPPFPGATLHCTSWTMHSMLMCSPQPPPQPFIHNVADARHMLSHDERRPLCQQWQSTHDEATACCFLQPRLSGHKECSKPRAWPPTASS
jgi:hypothetical protein